MARKRNLPPGMWLRGNVYWACFRAHGRLVRERLSTDFRSASIILNDLRARADRADFGLRDNKYPWKKLKDEFFKWVDQAIRRPQDYRGDIAAIESFAEINSVDQMSAEFVMKFRRWRLDHGASPRTVNKHVRTLNIMLNKGVDWGCIHSNRIRELKPLRHDEKLKERRALTSDEVSHLLEHSSASLKPVWRMLLCTGIRKQELVAMTFDDVDFDRGTITVRAKTAKSHRAREIPLDREMLDTLRELRQEAIRRKPVKGLTDRLTERQKANFSRRHVFVTKANTPWRNNLLTRFYAICRKAGIEGAEPGGTVDIHSLRVTFATLAIEGGAHPKAVQAILGHATLDLTMGVYTRATERSKREAIGALPFGDVKAPDHVLTMQSAHNALTVEKPSPEHQAATKLA